MKSYLRGELHAQFVKLGYKWLPFHLVGVRSKADIPNSFDDKFYLVNEINPTNPVFWETSCTTNPGLYWMQKVVNAKGAAVLKPNQWKECWQLGKHKGVYEALVQCAPVSVYRDNDKDDKAEEQGILDTGLFGINIHRANASAVSKIIDQWSAGCQVLNDPTAYAKLLEACKASGVKKFTYTLLKEF